MRIRVLFVGLLASLFLLSCTNSSQTSQDTPPEYCEVTFKNYDATVLYYSSVKYGENAVYQGETPTRKSTNEYRYAFLGWDKPLENIKKDTIFIAQYSQLDNSFDVTWNVDGDITVEHYAYGEIPSYKNGTPTRSSTAQYSYVFSQWEPSIKAVTEDITYTAQFDSVVNQYKITWNVDGVETEELYDYGSIPSYKNGTPTKKSTQQYSYSFSGWNPSIHEVQEDATYTAMFSSSVNKYQIRWLNYDGSEITTEYLDYGSIPSFNLEDPCKPSDSQYTYQFIGWSPSIETVTGNQDYTALFDGITRSYTVTWDVNGVTTKEVYQYGSTPSYKNGTPTKEQYQDKIYTFSGWLPKISNVVGDVTYVAQFSVEIEKYTVTWKNYDGMVLETDKNVSYGSIPSYDGKTPEKEADYQNIYIFTGWSPTFEPVTSNVVYTAQFDSAAHNFTIEKNEIKSYNGQAEEVTIPSKINGYKIQVIDGTAFRNNTYIKKVNIPDTVSYIDYAAFRGCTKLETINIPNIVVSFYSEIFSGCISLKNINMPNDLMYISSSAFAGCLSLTKVSFSSKLQRIEENAFYSCSSLEEVSFTEGTSLTEIGQSAFKGCSALKQIDLPSLNTLTYSVFEDCTALESITLPSNMTQFHERALKNNPNLREIKLSQSNTKYAVDDNVLFTKDKTELIKYPSSKEGSTYTIPDNVTKLANYAFEGNRNLEHINLNNLTRLEGEIFTNCKELRGMSFSSSFEYVDSNNFRRCPKFESISVDSSNSYYCSVDGVLYSKDLKYLAAYPCGKKDKVYSVQSGVEEIYYSAFSYNDFIEQIILPEGVKYIDSLSFAYCSSLKLINLPESIVRMYPSTFASCTSLRSITIPSQIAEIPAYCFSLCSSLESIDFLGEITTINKLAFQGCSNLKTFEIPSSVINICDSAFTSCTSLTDVTIPDSVTSLQSYAFQNCTSLAMVNYLGTIRQWGSITKGNLLFDNTLVTFIQCSNGIVNL